MQKKLLVSAAAIAYLVTGLGSASAGDVFATLEGVSAGTMSEAALQAVRGGVFTLRINPMTAPGQSPVPQITIRMDAFPQAARDGLGTAGAATGNIVFPDDS